MNTETSPDRSHLARMWLLVTITVILAGWALKATAAFMVPVAFGVFLALLVAPLVRMVADRVPEKLGWLGHVVAFGAILVCLLASVGLIWFSAQQLVARFPMPSEVGSLLPQLGESSGTSSESASASTGDGGGASAGQSDGSSGGSGLVAQVRELLSGAGGSFAGQVADWASGFASRILGTAGATLSAVVLVLFLTLIMLIEAPKWQQKVVSVQEPQARHKTLESVATIADLLRRYLLARTVLGLITAVLYVVWLWIFGIDLLIVWALLTFLMSYIPTVGSLIAGVLPVLYAFLQKDFGSALAVAGGILVIEQVIGNFVDPRVQGRQVSLSPLVILITLLVWGWIWGIAGAILAVPLTIAAMIICAHVARLRPFALMLSNETDLDGLDRQTGVTERQQG